VDVEVSSYVSERAMREGVRPGLLYTSLFALLVIQGFVNSYAGITLPNAASVGLHDPPRFAPSACTGGRYKMVPA